MSHIFLLFKQKTYIKFRRTMESNRFREMCRHVAGWDMISVVCVGVKVGWSIRHAWYVCGRRQGTVCCGCACVVVIVVIVIVVHVYKYVISVINILFVDQVEIRKNQPNPVVRIGDDTTASALPNDDDTVGTSFVDCGVECCSPLSSPACSLSGWPADDGASAASACANMASRRALRALLRRW